MKHILSLSVIMAIASAAQAESPTVHLSPDPDYSAYELIIRNANTDEVRHVAWFDEHDKNQNLNTCRATAGIFQNPELVGHITWECRIAKDRPTGQ